MTAGAALGEEAWPAEGVWYAVVNRGAGGFIPQCMQVQLQAIEPANSP